MIRITPFALLLTLTAAPATPAGAQGTPAPVASARRPMQVADIDRLRTVRDPQISPDGGWVAYTVLAANPETDKDDTDVWMSSWDGAEHVQLTSTPQRESTARWSPDGKWLAFLSGRTQGESDKVEGAQVWLLSRQGGEARRLTDRKGGVSDVAWSPDSTRLVLVGTDPDPEEDPEEADRDNAKKPKTRKPIVIDRYHFKEDGDGYLTRRYSHLYLFTIATRRLEPLTKGEFDDRLPAWSPDGTRIAFISKQGEDPDRTNDTNLYVIEAKAGAEARQLTTWTGPDHEARPAWSPDGTRIAYLQGSEPKYYAYNRNHVAVVSANGQGTPAILTASLDRDVEFPVWASDGRSIYFTVVDDRARHLARIAAGGGPIERLVTGRRVVGSLTMSREGRLAGLSATATRAVEVHALEGNRVRQISKQNDEWLNGLDLASVEDIDYTTKDGARIGALLVRPAGAGAERLPLVLFIHGGPNSQDQHELDLESQLFAAHGYAVLLANYRGSAGRDTAHQTAIYADWGNKEVVDLLAGVDHVVAKGIADPERLAIGGWSYGGILTNYTIATDTRFKAAVSGAGSSLQTSIYGTDQYTFQYDTEMGRPWKNPEVWLKVSYPFFKADHIRTPTLFMCGEQDFNVPIAGAEQMYQALKSEGVVDTQLVIYPGQHHGLTIPSYRRDRLQRYLDWYAKYLKPAAGTK